MQIPFFNMESIKCYDFGLHGFLLERNYHVNACTLKMLI
jgi:hypothetical protein